MPPLKNDILLLRAVEPEDLERLYLWENDTQLWEVGNTRSPYSRYALKEYILQQENDLYTSKQLRLMMVALNTNETVGTVDLFDFDIHNSRIALGLFVDKPFRGKGYARNALKIVENYVFQFLKINQLYCEISANNTESKLMFENENYESNGVLKNWIKTQDGYTDIIVFQRFKTL
jgi:diamine N-acetyltransferase